MIKQDKSGKWWLHYSTGRKEGPFSSRKKAMNRERQVQYFKYKNKHESSLQEGIYSGAVKASIKDYIPSLKRYFTKAKGQIRHAVETPERIKAGFRDQVRQGMEQGVDNKVKELTPKIKKGGALLMAGVGGAAAGGSYIGGKAGNKKRKIKESNPMLFPFTIGIHSALAKTRDGEPNYLIQEGVAESIARILGTGKRYKSSVLSPEKLGEAMHRNHKVMNQAFRLYGSDSKTLKKAFPNAFGVVKR